MSTNTTIHDLPNEMLEYILLHLELTDRKSALQVCRRWSLLKPFNWSSIKLAIKFPWCKKGEEESYCQCLLTSDRRYKQLDYYYEETFESENFELFLKILRHFNRTVESLVIMFCGRPIFWEVKMFAQIAELGSNLRHLIINFCVFINNENVLGFPPMPKLEQLVVCSNLISMIPRMKDVTPNIKRLHIGDYWVLGNFDEPRRFLGHVSSSLVELSMKLDSHEDFLQLCEVKFTCLVKLRIEFVRDSDPDPLEIDHFIADFIQQTPGLVDVGLCSIRLTTQNIQNLCRKCAYLQCLDVYMTEGDSFAAMCELKYLKRLTINGYISVPTVLCTQLKSLNYLSLWCAHIIDEKEFNRFIRSNFPSLTVLKLAYINSASSQKFDLLRNVCNNITSLQQLELWEQEANLCEFLEFCAACAPQDLIFHCQSFSNAPAVVNVHLAIAVRTLTLDVPNINSTMLRTLIDSMKELRRLKMETIGHCTQRVVSTVAKQFPRCRIFINRERPC